MAVTVLPIQRTPCLEAERITLRKLCHLKCIIIAYLKALLIDLCDFIKIKRLEEKLAGTKTERNGLPVNLIDILILAGDYYKHIDTVSYKHLEAVCKLYHVGIRLSLVYGDKYVLLALCKLM